MQMMPLGSMKGMFHVFHEREEDDVLCARTLYLLMPHLQALNSIMSRRAGQGRAEGRTCLFAYASTASGAIF